MQAKVTERSCKLATGGYWWRFPTRASTMKRLSYGMESRLSPSFGGILLRTSIVFMFRSTFKMIKRVEGEEMSGTGL